MLDQLSKIENRYLELEKELSDPSVMTDIARYKKLTKERSSIEEIVTEYRSFRTMNASLQECREMLFSNSDPEMTPLIREEMAELEEKLTASEQRLKELLIPKDPNDDKNTILEIRAGTGGDEAALFAGDLYRMYARYAERKGYTFEVVSMNDTDMGGVKEAIVSVGGKAGTYSRLKFESGVHRVQRVPVTESQGRIQTSAATVAVMPEVDDLDIEIRDADIRIDTYRSSGAGGQHVNKTSSAIRITHIPTGIVVQCQDERSQFKNKDKAMRVLKSSVYEYYESIKNKDIVEKRKTMVGSGDRSERIRTYNFPQNRLTDHRINKTMYKLELYMDGDLDEMIDAMILAERAAKLSGEQE